MTFDMDFDDPAGDQHDHTETLSGKHDGYKRYLITNSFDDRYGKTYS